MQNEEKYIRGEEIGGGGRDETGRACQDIAR